MRFQEVINQRHSVRDFKDKEVEENIVHEILRVADAAPSAGGLKARSVEVIRDRELKEQLAQVAHGQDWLAAAPVVLVFAADPKASAAKYGERGQALYAVQDATIAATLAWLAAVDAGLAAGWVGAFEPEQVRELAGMRRGLVPVCLMPVGYAA
jgi:nitroreductase